PPRRPLGTVLPDRLTFPEKFGEPRICLPGILAVQGPAYRAAAGDPTASAPAAAMERFCQAFGPSEALMGFPLVVVVDDSAWVARTLNNFLWVTFTRSNP